MTQADVDKSPGRVRRMFGGIAPRYDLLNHLLSLGLDYRWRRRTVRLAPCEDGGEMLDVCTGTGDLALAYDREGQGRYRIIGVDFAEPMLEIARKKSARAAGPDRVVFQEADALDLPFEADRFSLVTVAFGLRNMADTDAGIRELVRVCRPGGTVAILEFGMPRQPVIGPLYRFYFQRVLPRLGQLVSRSRDSAYAYLPASVSAFPQGAEMVDRIQRAGMTDVELHAMTFGTVYLYIGRKATDCGACEDAAG